MKTRARELVYLLNHSESMEMLPPSPSVVVGAAIVKRFPGYGVHRGSIVEIDGGKVVVHWAATDERTTLGGGRARRQRGHPPGGPRRPPPHEPSRRRAAGAPRAKDDEEAPPRRARRRAVAARPPPLGISKNIHHTPKRKRGGHAVDDV